MSSQDEFIVSFKRLIKPGWEYLDNSTILLLRLLDLVGPNSIAIAGLDGFDGESTASQYASPDLAPFVPRGESIKLNKEIQSMLNDYILHRKSKCPITFLTKSRFTIPD
jgi:4-hydroxy 2-oxovalerate aldolase